MIREYTGHGIGCEMHEDPLVPNFGPANQGPVLKKNMTMAIEPMATDAFVVIRHDKLVYERYSPDFNRNAARALFCNLIPVCMNISLTLS